mmetsp:Transcript_24778/g.74494  ORF Transcript_24778/g.74494 Transcript_24778/m.74494 type:complete len:177 (-) Transcript_24778:780-1310(-)
MRKITSRLPMHLDAKIAAEFVFDENYWKKRCQEQLPQRDCQINEHGLTWKQLFFERHLRTCFEEFESSKSEESSAPGLLSAASSSQDYVFTLKTQELRGHPDIESICKMVRRCPRIAAHVTYTVAQSRKTRNYIRREANRHEIRSNAFRNEGLRVEILQSTTAHRFLMPIVLPRVS